MNGFFGWRALARVATSATLAIAAPALAITLAAGAAAPALAQGQPVNSVTPYFAVVDKDDAILRAGGNDLMYPIMKLARGTVLRVDGETNDVRGATWARVSYPPGSFVFIPADAVSVDGKSGTLSKLARVKAPNQGTGVRGSWADATPQALGVGTKVSIIEAEPAQGTPTHFRIAPPEGARAFVPSALLRRASQDEINIYMARAAQTGTRPAVPTTPAETPSTAAAPPTTQASQPTGQPAAQPAAQPGTTAATPAGTTPPGGTLAEPMVIPQTPTTTATRQPPAGAGQPAPSATPSAAPAGGAPAASTPPSQSATGAPATTAQPSAAPATGTQPAVIDQRVTTPRPAPPANPFERLEAALQQIRQQPIESAEYAELLAQYQAELDKLEPTPTNQPMRQRLTQRVELLKLLMDAQAQRRALADNAAAATSGRSAIDQRLADVARNRQYTVVGRLTTSTLYDGQRLPLMYRVQAASGGSGRTLAYIRPDAVPDLDRKVGQIVGIIGLQAVDSSLQLNIISPTRVDVLQAVPGSQPAPAEPVAAEVPQPQS